MSFRARRGSAAVADAGKSAPAPHARSSWFGGGGGGAPARERDTSPTAPARRASGPPANAPPAPPFRPFAIAGGDELLLGPRLGTGGFASVHAATWRGGPVAAKLIAPRPATALALLGAGAAAGGGGSGGGGARADDATSAERAALAARREAEVLGMLRHPNVVALYALAPPSTLVMELCTGGSLASKLGASTLPTLGWGPRLELAAGIAAALEFVHTSGIVHLDIKSANVVLTPLAGGGSLPKLCDFGISSAASDEKITVPGGSPAYMAPEIARRQPALGRPVDSYGLGCVLHDLAHIGTGVEGATPLGDRLVRHAGGGGGATVTAAAGGGGGGASESRVDTEYAANVIVIRRAMEQYEPKVGAGVPAALASLLLALLAVDPGARPAAGAARARLAALAADPASLVAAGAGAGEEGAPLIHPCCAFCADMSALSATQGGRAAVAAACAAGMPHQAGCTKGSRLPFRIV